MPDPECVRIEVEFYDDVIQYAGEVRKWIMSGEAMVYMRGFKYDGKPLLDRTGAQERA